MKSPRLARLLPALLALWFAGFVASSAPTISVGHPSASVTADHQATFCAGSFDQEGADVDDDGPDFVSDDSVEPAEPTAKRKHAFTHHQQPCAHAHWLTLPARGPPAV